MAVISEEKALEWLVKFKEPIKGIFSGLKNEIINAFDVGLSKYIYDRERKLSKINTFISRDKKVEFYKVYFSQTISSHSTRKFNSDAVLDNLFNDSNCVAIVASAGSGKTMLMKHIFLSCKNEYYKIPIFIELRDFNSRQFNFVDYLYKYALSNKIKPSEKILERALLHGSFLFLFDGYDELSHDKKVTIMDEIQTFIDLYPKNQFVFSSRPGTGIEYYQRIVKFSIDDLNYKEINEFIEKQAFLLKDKKLIDKLKSQLRTIHGSSYASYLKNPLLLSMFILTYKDYPEIPKTKSKFYFNVFDTLTVKHNSVSKREGFVHPRKTSLNFEEFDRILQGFSFIATLDNEFKFSRSYLKTKLQTVKSLISLKYDIDELIYDMQVCIAILTEDGDEFSFPHRTMQDYFASLYIRNLDTETKTSIYRNHFPNNQQLYGNSSLLALCLEMDEAFFIENFVLPIARSAKGSFSKNEYENVLTFIELFNAAIYIEITPEKGKMEVRLGFISWTLGNSITALAFLYHNELSPFWNIKVSPFVLPNTSPLYKYLIRHMNKWRDSHFTRDEILKIPKALLEEVFTKSKFLLNATHYIKKIKEFEGDILKKYNSSKSTVNTVMNTILEAQKNKVSK